MLSNIQEKFAALSQREKIIVTFALLAAIGFSWDHFFYQPTQKKQQSLQQELSRLKQQTNELKLAITKLKNTSYIDPNLNNQNKLTELKAEYNRQRELMMTDKSLVTPQLMASALGDMLNQNKQLSLIKLNTLPVAPLVESKHPQQNPIYKHGLIITFSGSYLDTLNYLKALERLPWHFIWDSIDYQVKDHPIAETTIKIYTLSFKESWLDV